MKTQNYRPFMELAKRRKTLVFGFVVPSLMLLRFPWLALALYRTAALVLVNVFTFVMRNPALQRRLGSYIWKVATEYYKQVAARASAAGAARKAKSGAKKASGARKSGGTGTGAGKDG